MKSYIFLSLILSFFSFFSTSKAQNSLDGLYPHNSNLSNFCYGKVEISSRKNGSLKVNFLETNKEPYAFIPVEGSVGVFESNPIGNHGDILRMEELEKDALIVYELDPYRRVTAKTILSKDKKLLKKLMKEHNMIMSLAEEIALLKGKNNGKEEEKPVQFFPMNPTSDFHAKNVGKIVFFSEKPTIGQEDPTKIKTKFKVGEPVWAIAYLPVALNTQGGEDLYNHFTNNFGRSFKYAAVGIYKTEEDLLEDERRIVRVCSVKALKDEDLTKNYIVFQVIPTPTENEMDEDGASFIGQQMSKMLENYEHELMVTLTGKEGTGSGIISGNFFYDASEGTEQLKNMNEEIEKAQLARKRLPTPVFRDADLEASMIQQIELFAHAKGWDNKWVKAIIASDWTILKDDMGNIKGRYIEAYCVYKNDKECGYINFGFIKDYLGDGRYNDSIRQHDIGERGAVTCDKVE